MKPSIALILALGIIFNLAYSLNDSPIIGILTVPSEYPDYYSSQNYSYFASSYVQYIESSGGRVYPLKYDLPRDEFFGTLDKLNGVLFTGGSTGILYPNNTLAPFGQAMQNVIDYVMDQHKKGVYFPLWGTCEGYQMITMLITM